MRIRHREEFPHRYFLNHEIIICGRCMRRVPVGICSRWRWGRTAVAWCCSSPNIAAPPRRAATAGNWRCGGPTSTSSPPLPPSELYMPPAGPAAPPLVGEERGKEDNKRGGFFGKNGIKVIRGRWQKQTDRKRHKMQTRTDINRRGNLPRLLVYRPWVWFVRISCLSSSSSIEKGEKGGKIGRVRYKGRDGDKNTNSDLIKVDFIFSNFYIKTSQHWASTFQAMTEISKTCEAFRADFSQAHCSPHKGNHFFLSP